MLSLPPSLPFFLYDYTHKHRQYMYLYRYRYEGTDTQTHAQSVCQFTYRVSWYVVS